MSAAGPCTQPIFHPVVEKVFPADEMVSVRSAAPGRVAIGTCGASKVRCSYTSSVTITASCRAARRTTSRRTSSSKTAPVGLCGSLTRMILVRSVTASAS